MEDIKSSIASGLGIVMAPRARSGQPALASPAIKQPPALPLPAAPAAEMEMEEQLQVKAAQQQGLEAQQPRLQGVQPSAHRGLMGLLTTFKSIIRQKDQGGCIFVTAGFPFGCMLPVIWPAQN